MGFAHGMDMDLMWIKQSQSESSMWDVSGLRGVSDVTYTWPQNNTGGRGADPLPLHSRRATCNFDSPKTPLLIAYY